MLIVAVVGPGEDASRDAIGDAEAAGEGIAERGWLTLTGGRNAGVMAAATRGAARRGGLTLGLLPGATRVEAAPELTIALTTALGEARNAVLASCADAVIACGMNPGTASEVALALRARKPVILVRPETVTADFFRALPGHGEANLHVASSAESALVWLEARLGVG